MDALLLRLYVRLRHEGVSSSMEPIYRDLEMRVASEIGRNVAALSNDELIGLLATDATPALEPLSMASLKTIEEVTNG